MADTFTFEVVSRKYGRFVFVAPERFRREIEERSWYASRTKSGGVYGRTAIRVGDRQRQVFLHRFIWKLSGRPLPPLIDHVDRDTLNNAEDNLRATSCLGNSQNIGVRRVSSTGVVGVTPRYGKWIARIRANNVERHIGTFDDFAEAVAARDAAALVLHGDFAYLNNPSARP